MLKRWTLVILLTALAIAVRGAAAQAQDVPSLAIDPPDLAIEPSSGPFEVRVLVQGVTEEPGLGGYALALAFDPDVLRAVSVVDGGLLEESGNPATCPASATDNDAGQLAHFCLSIPIFGETGVLADAPQVLAVVTFEPVGEGATTLDLTDSSLVDPQGGNLSTATANGRVTVGDPAATESTEEAGPAAEQASDGEGGGNAGLYLGIGIAAAVAAVLITVGVLFAVRRARSAG
ncbi:MAG: hypothetical protein HY723_04870 [Chloroflexi bacterium]|nr:hypothetical protein [Chloroflexota bacterium]